jgi:hypothetical protein
MNPGIVFSREALLDKVWGGDTYVTDRTVDTVVSLAIDGPRPLPSDTCALAGSTFQLATVSGDVMSGYVATLTVGVAAG